MINSKYDEKFALKLSLQVMSEMRDNLIHDTLNIEPKLHCGLHKSNMPEVRDLYLERYIVLWLSNHWTKLDEVLKEHNEYSKESRKNMTIYFSKFFADFINISRDDNYLSNLAIPMLLQQKLNALDEMKLLSDKWEEISNKLKLDIIKNDEEYNRLLKECEEC